MGERKGVNKYYPPDYDPSKGGLNKFQGTHALRERARKLHMGILIIRFEMPYNIWCEGCENHIGTGVRYNAEKKKVGMYYSTPIYQFRMKCHLCDNHFEIKTDPANLDYEIVSGARRQERRWDPTDNEQIVPEDKEVTRKMASDAMFKLEHGVDDKKQAQEKQTSIERLEEFQTRRWHDDYSVNSRMRNTMRARRTEEQEQAVRDASYNLSIPLLPPNENDIKTAKLLQFTQAKTADQLLKEKRSSIDAHSVFAKLKPKSVSPLEKKAFARQSLKNIVNSSSSSLDKVKTSIKPQHLGIVVKKIDNKSHNENHSDLSGNLNEDSICRCKKDISSSQDLGENSITSICKCCDSINKTGISGFGDTLGKNDLPNLVLSSKVDTKLENNNMLMSSQSSTTGSSSPKKEMTISSLVGYDYSDSESD